MTSRQIREREEGLKTLKVLFDYAAANYETLPMSHLLDGDQEYTYGSFAQTCRRISDLMSLYRVGAGERVAILSQNMPNWTVAYFSAVAFSRVTVPILADSSPVEVENILSHSGAKVLFVSKAKIDKITEERLSALTLVFNIDTLELIRVNGSQTESLPELPDPKPEDLAGIFYTSGTTGNAKGVMLCHRNFCQNIVAAWYTNKFTEGQVWMSILPMAHTYEMAFSLLYPFYVGGQVYYLRKAPTPSVLKDALARIKPHVVCSVPLIIEKVYKSSVLPTVAGSKFLTWMQKYTPALLYRIVGKKVKGFFGGRLEFFGIGGAKLDPDVEKFLQQARFPYAIGYGLTETAPLICSGQVGKGRVGSIGWHSHNIEVRLGDVDPQTGEGEIQCKGPNVMLGYYKDPERTASVFTEDGWFKTGDLATVDKDGYYYIKGRIGSMIVGPSGENIYPEIIESVINEFDGVSESLVVSREGKLVALVKFDDAIVDWAKETEEKFTQYLKEKQKEVLDYVNARVSKSNRVNEVEAVKEPFIKTATMKIRRFLYQKKQGK